MSRDTIASGAVPNTFENLVRWIRESGCYEAGILDAGDGIKRSGHPRRRSISGDTSVNVQKEHA